jgi:hypothetical protein
VGLTLSIAWAASSPIDDRYSVMNTQWNGTSELAKRGFLAVTSTLGNTLSSTDLPAVLLIIGPTRQFTEADANSIAGFVAGGGLLIVADNSGSGNGLLELLGLPVRFDGRVLIDPLFYRKQPNFPVVFDFLPSEFSAGVHEVVLNYATALSIQPGSDVKLLASSSPFSFLDSNNSGEKDSDEPSGPFPVLAEVALGDGFVILFSSPASLANDLVDEANNNILLENFIKHASQPTRATVLLLDETHLQPSPFTPTKLAAQGLLTTILQGGMWLGAKFGLAALTITIIAARFMYRKPLPEKAERSGLLRTAATFDVDSVLSLHPTWDRRKLEYVAREVEGAMRWRRLHEEE